MRAMAHLPDPVKIWLSGTAPVIVDGQQLDPQLQLLRSIRRRHRVLGLVEPTVAAGRARYRRETIAFRGPVTKLDAIRDLEIVGASGPLRARHYAPVHGSAAPLTVYFTAEDSSSAISTHTTSRAVCSAATQEFMC